MLCHSLAIKNPGVAGSILLGNKKASREWLASNLRLGDSVTSLRESGFLEQIVAETLRDVSLPLSALDSDSHLRANYAEIREMQVISTGACQVDPTLHHGSRR